MNLAINARDAMVEGLHGLFFAVDDDKRFILITTKHRHRRATGQSRPHQGVN
jgi:hypothetical protein